MDDPRWTERFIFDVHDPDGEVLVGYVGRLAPEKELQRPLSDEEELQVLQRERKRRVEAAEAFRTGGREEQAQAEEGELAVLEEFMPEPLSDDELDEIVDDAIAENGATSMRDFGRVMADVMPQVAGRADGSAVSQLVREKPPAGGWLSDHLEPGASLRHPDEAANRAEQSAREEQQ